MQLHWQGWVPPPVSTDQPCWNLISSEPQGEAPFLLQDSAMLRGFSAGGPEGQSTLCPYHPARASESTFAL